MTRWHKSGQAGVWQPSHKGADARTQGELYSPDLGLVFQSQAECQDWCDDHNQTTGWKATSVYHLRPRFVPFLRRADHG